MKKIIAITNCAKAIALALVVNNEGFVKYNNIYQGNIADWQNIVRIMNTQKVATVFMKGRNNKQIMYSVCSKPTIGALEIYNAMGFEPMPFYRKKICVTENQNPINPIC